MVPSIPIPKMGRVSLSCTSMGRSLSVLQGSSLALVSSTAGGNASSRPRCRFQHLHRRSFSSDPFSSSYDAIIVGAGVMGNVIALELARKGFTTLSIEKSPAAGAGSTSCSAGIIRTAYSVPESVMMAFESYKIWQHWDEYVRLGGSVSNKTNAAELAFMRECGGVTLKTEGSKTFISKCVKAFEQVGVKYELWSPQEVAERLQFDLTCYGPPKRIDDEAFGEPNGESVEGALFAPETGYVNDPKLAAENLRRAAEQTEKSKFVVNAKVVGILREGGKCVGVRVLAADGSEKEVSSKLVVNCAGPHSSQITKLAFPNGVAADADGPGNDMKQGLTTRPMRQEIAYVNAPAGWPGMVVTDFDTGVYLRGEGDKILIGSIEPDCDEQYHEWYDEDPDVVMPGNAKSGISDQWTNQVYRLGLRLPTMALPDSANTQGIVSLYDVTEDWCPIYDRSALPGFYMAIGTSGNQFKMAPVVGPLMGNIIEATENGANIDETPLRLP